MSGRDTQISASTNGFQQIVLNTHCALHGEEYTEIGMVQLGRQRLLQAFKRKNLIQGFNTCTTDGAQNLKRR
jgi:hypothetical protein